MKKFAMSFLSELSATWRKRRASLTMPVRNAHTTPETGTQNGVATASKRILPKDVTHPKSPSLHDIASNM